MYRHVKPIISAADFAIGNLEVTLAGPPYKGYPRFCSPDELAVASKYAGFDILTTANNHCVDRGKKGLERTIDVLDTLGIYHLGTYKDQKHRDTANFLILVKDSMRIALLNYTYGTNYIEPTKPNIVNYIDREQMKKDLDTLQNFNIDQTIIFIHWGKEYKSHPDDEMKDLASWMFANGADIVIGGHPHYVQPMYWDKEKDQMIAYSLGNYVSNQRARRKDGGVMVELKFVRENREVKLATAGYILTWVHKQTISGKDDFTILPCSRFENKPDYFSNAADYKKMKLFINDSRKLFREHNQSVPEIKP
jgi:poly-gamma-glutamate synthesis protein (capsule biosynthesis protein)